MQDTGIFQEISTLREQIAVAEATIERRKSQGSPGSAPGPDIGELVEARDFMLARLSRVESCKRTPDT